MSKRVIEPNTTFYPVAVALITTGGETPNVMTANRLASVSAEPPPTGPLGPSGPFLPPAYPAKRRVCGQSAFPETGVSG